MTKSYCFNNITRDDDDDDDDDYDDPATDDYHGDAH